MIENNTNSSGQLSKNQYLLNYRKDIASQFGEDGIIEKILEFIPDQNKWCVEFGAWDGKHFSNTYNLIANKGWSGVLIEGNPVKCNDLRKTYENNPKAYPINRMVGFSENDSLDSILKDTPIPHDFDFLSIDIDGLDFHIWESVQKYRPKFIVIEFNSFIPNDIEFVQEKDFSKKHGNSILSITKLSKSKGYELICINQENAFFVDKKYFHLFNIENNTINELKHFKAPLQVFQLYDGTVVFHGAQYLYYYNMPYNFNKKCQALPKFIRNQHIPWSTGWLVRTAKYFHGMFFKKKEAPVTDPDNKCWGWKMTYSHLNKNEI
jgi:hypothetical protein